MSSLSAVVAGGTGGVGLGIVRALAERGFSVHFIGRDAEKGRAVEKELADGGHGACKFHQVDLSSIRATKHLTTHLKAELDSIDVLVLSAGVLGVAIRKETSEGFELSLATCHLTAWLLTRELVPLLEKSNSHPRIVNISASVDPMLKPDVADFEDLNWTKKYEGVKAGQAAVWCKTVATEVWADRLRGKVDVIAVHPGNIKGGLSRNMGFPLKQIFSLMSLCLPAVSKSGVHASTADELNGKTALFINMDCKSTPLSFPQGNKERVWSETEKMVDRTL